MGVKNCVSAENIIKSFLIFLVQELLKFLSKYWKMTMRKIVTMTVFFTPVKTVDLLMMMMTVIMISVRLRLRVEQEVK